MTSRQTNAIKITIYHVIVLIKEILNISPLLSMNFAIGRSSYTFFYHVLFKCSLRSVVLNSELKKSYLNRQLFLRIQVYECLVRRVCGVEEGDEEFADTPGERPRHYNPLETSSNSIKVYPYGRSGVIVRRQYLFTFVSCVQCSKLPAQHHE